MSEDQMPTVTTRLRWDGNDLYAGKMPLGWVRQSSDNLFYIGSLTVFFVRTNYHTRSEARAALLAAAVKALGDE